MTSPSEPSRRDTLTILLWGSLLTAVAPAIYVAGRYLRPLKMEGTHASAGPESAIRPDSPRIIRVGSADAMVMRNGTGELYALNLRCTHAGCNVRWQQEQGIFICPCHDGRFDSAGRVIKGPPVAPLVRLEVRVEGGTVIVTDMPISTAG